MKIAKELGLIIMTRIILLRIKKIRALYPVELRRKS